MMKLFVDHEYHSSGHRNYFDVEDDKKVNAVIADIIADIAAIPNIADINADIAVIADNADVIADIVVDIADIVADKFDGY